MSLHITDDPAADTLLTENPLALLIGMLLDQQVAMETAFSGPLKIQERIGAVDAATIAGYDPDALVAAFQQSPAVHRYPGSMAGRVQTLCRALEQDWGGDAAALWTEGDPDGPTVLKRLKALPGFGEQKAKIFLALLGKQYGFTGAGWREAAGAYGEDGSYRSVADIVSPSRSPRCASSRRRRRPRRSPRRAEAFSTRRAAPRSTTGSCALTGRRASAASRNAEPADSALHEQVAALVVETTDDEAATVVRQHLLAHAQTPRRRLGRIGAAQRLDVLGDLDGRDDVRGIRLTHRSRRERPRDQQAVAVDTLAVLVELGAVVGRAVLVDEVLHETHADRLGVEVGVAAHKRVEGPGDGADVAGDRPLALLLLEQASEPATLVLRQYARDVGVHGVLLRREKNATEAPTMRSPSYRPTT
jgi:uncharacterized HhH-GPD family protein